MTTLLYMAVGSLLTIFCGLALWGHMTSGKMVTWDYGPPVTPAQRRTHT